MMAKVKVLENTKVKLGKGTDHVRQVINGVVCKKYYNGDLILEGSLICRKGTTEMVGNHYRSLTVEDVRFPMNFVETPSVYCQTNGAGAYGTAFNSKSREGFNFRLIHFYNQTVATEVVWEAKGRWK